MPAQRGSDVYYDPYDVGIMADPYPVYRRMREESPLYYNEAHDFYALSRFDDVERGLLDAATFISGKGGILELIRADIELPPGRVHLRGPPGAYRPSPSHVTRLLTPARGRARGQGP